MNMRSNSFGDGTGIDKVVTSLVDFPPAKAPILDKGNPPPIPQKTGTGKATASTGKSSGIASPLTESGARTFWADKAYTSSDGIFTLQVKPVKLITFLDANGATVQFQLAQPT